MALQAPTTVNRTGAETELATLIYEYTAISTNSLWSAFELAKNNRGNPRGITTDQEQDLLRAMLVMAASGLDAALKQLIRDCIPKLIARMGEVHEPFEKFTQKRLQGDDSQAVTGANAKFLARILASPHPQTALIEDYVYELTGDSLQSAEQVFRVLAAFAIAPKEIVGDLKKLRDVFQTRNQIIHELDMNLASPNRKRRVRSQTQLKLDTEIILGLCADIITAVDSRTRV